MHRERQLQSRWQRREVKAIQKRTIRTKAKEEDREEKKLPTQTNEARETKNRWCSLNKACHHCYCYSPKRFPSVYKAILCVIIVQRRPANRWTCSWKSKIRLVNYTGICFKSMQNTELNINASQTFLKMHGYLLTLYSISCLSQGRNTPAIVGLSTSV